MEIEYAPHVEEIKKALDNEIDEVSIIAELKKLLQFRVPLSEAKRSLIKKYGGAEKSIVRKLNEIKIGDHNIEVTAEVLEVIQKTINIKNIEKIVFTGNLRDETAVRSFSAWSDHDLKVGDVINITGAYVRNWQERPEINFSPRAKVTKLSTRLQAPEESALRKLSEFKDGDINVHTEFTILSIDFHDINTKDGTKKIISGIIADEETKLPLTSWVIYPELEAGNTIEIKNGYVRSFRGIPNLNINEGSKITKILRNIEFRETVGSRIEDLIEKDGAYDIVVEGNILSIRPGSGLINRCPRCSRVIQKGMCRAHGKVEDKADMRIKAIIDDGTGAMTLVLDSRLTHKICGIGIEEAINLARIAMSQKAVEEEIKRKLQGRRFAARGNMSKGEFGITLVANDVWEPLETLQDKAKKLLGRLAD
ncbi:MAG: Single-stranded DNA binding protein [Candidatus Methanoperedens sp.]